MTEVVVDPQGFVYAGEYGNPGVFTKLDQNGDYVWEYTGHSMAVDGLAVAPGRYAAFPGGWESLTPL